MKLTVDTEANTVTTCIAGEERTMPLYSREAFDLISTQWVRVGWGQKYSYKFSWLGRPIIQLPEDMVRTQEVIFQVQPDLIIETGVAHGGSLIFYASLCKLLGKGRVIGVDIEIRPHNRAAIEAHPLADLVTLVEADSVGDAALARVRDLKGDAKTVLVILDSNHSYDHVMKELELYAPFVSVGSYIIATDGVMRDLTDVPGGRADWRDDNPARAAEDFAARSPSFEIVEPPRGYDESKGLADVTYWPSAYLLRTA